MSYKHSHNHCLAFQPNSRSLDNCRGLGIVYKIQLSQLSERLASDFAQKQSSNSFLARTRDNHMCVYMWKNNLFAVRESIKTSDYNKTLLLCHLVQVGGNQAKDCIDKKCVIRTVMPLLKYCCSRFAKQILRAENSSTSGNLKHLSETQ
jgi:hypothetical protein